MVHASPLNQRFYSPKTILGVFVQSIVTNELTKQQPNILKFPNFKALIDVSRQLEETIAVYFFSEQHINFKKKQIHGIAYNHQLNRWEHDFFPLPHVVYHFSKKTKRNTTILSTMKNKYRIQFINTPLDHNTSWKEYEILSKQADIRIPYSTQGNLRSPSILRRKMAGMLEQYPILHIKGTFAKKEREMKITKVNHNRIRYHLKLKKPITKHVKTMADLIKVFKRYYSANIITIQQPIPHLQVKSQPIHFRAELQRGLDGELNVTGITAKIGQMNALTTVQGQYITFEQCMKKHFKFNDIRLSQLKNNITYLLQKTHITLEEYYGKMGEIGVDFALDQQLNFWYIKSNRRSNKQAFCKAHVQKQIEALYLNTLYYAQYLQRNR
ncbi:YheC/YheD family protein [Longirhabdus pacifica]|uniref:YheC/YheD family protein n=1 Tax=Longirhabdus pacifica TaxID=2305227 RepID=UPI0013E8AE4E|nr:YheC/YheD family protein [Longirhabdus pacifica]